MNISKIIFLDRDGTLNEEVNYLHRPEDLCFVPGVPEALRRLREAGYLLVMITNQAGIARGYYSEADCETLNQFMQAELQKQGAGLDAAYYCPHHPLHGIGAYKKQCSCRKPMDGLFLQAEWDLFPACRAADPAAALMDSGNVFGAKDGVPHGAEAALPAKAGGGPASGHDDICIREAAGPVQLYQSGLRLSEETCERLRRWNRENPLRRGWYMIGDKRIDTEAGHRFGISSILVGSGYGKTEREKAAADEYEAYFETLLEAAEWILKQEQ